MSSFAVGIDLGGTNLRIAAVDSDGNLLEKITLGTQVSRGRDFVIGEMCEAIKSLTDKYSLRGTLTGVGLGIPGIIDKRTGMLRESPNLPGWHDYPVRDDISNRLGTEVILENDANAAAFGENWLGAGRGYDEMSSGVFLRRRECAGCDQSDCPVALILLVHGARPDGRRFRMQFDRTW